MRIFHEKELAHFLSDRLNVLRQEVQNESKNRLLNVNEMEYRDYLVSKYNVEPLNFQWELMDVSDTEKKIPAENFPYGFNVRRGESYRRQLLTFRIPFVGESELLALKPSVFLMWTTEVKIVSNTICLEVINFRNDSQEIKKNVEDLKRNIIRQLEYVLNDVSSYNLSLPYNAEYTIQSRKNDLLKMSDLLSSLGVAVRKAANVPDTFAVPVHKTKPIIKPTTTDEPFNAEPSLDESIYQDILKICYQAGIEMERHPSIYFDKVEETLRDHFLMVLSPHFQSVTGETFNKKGKTDILIRHEQSNVFVAECKFWKGEKAFLSGIKQTLSYLTWRDSKAAIICFVRNKDVEAAIVQVEAAARKSDCFVSFNGTKNQGWLDFNFRLEKDSPRGVRLSVLLFHFPL